MDVGTLVIWVLWLLLNLSSEFGSASEPRLSPETVAYRDRLRREREQKRAEARLREKEAARKARERAREQAHLRVREARAAREAREAAERKAIEARRERLDAETVVFETADDAFPEMPSVSLREA